MILFHIIFYISVFCILGHEKNLPHESEGNIHLAAEMKKLTYSEENPVFNIDDNSQFSTMEELQRELSVQRATNRDLNRTISDILDRMADMERNILRATSRATWCGYRPGAWDSLGIIPYEYISYSSNNMGITDTVLDIDTGNFSHKLC